MGSILLRPENGAFCMCCLKIAEWSSQIQLHCCFHKFSFCNSSQRQITLNSFTQWSQPLPYSTNILVANDIRMWWKTLPTAAAGNLKPSQGWDKHCGRLRRISGGTVISTNDYSGRMVAPSRYQALESNRCPLDSRWGRGSDSRWQIMSHNGARKNFWWLSVPIGDKSEAVYSW